MVTELESIDRDGWPVTWGWFLDATADRDESVFAISSDDRLVESVHASRMSVGSGHGWGGMRVLRNRSSKLYVSRLPDRSCSSLRFLMLSKLSSKIVSAPGVHINVG